MERALVVGAVARALPTELYCLGWFSVVLVWGTCVAVVVLPTGCCHWCSAFVLLECVAVVWV